MTTSLNFVTNLYCVIVVIYTKPHDQTASQRLKVINDISTMEYFCYCEQFETVHFVTT